MMLRRCILSLFICIVSSSAEDCFEKLQWSTAEGQILVNGQPLVLKGINYPGFQTESYAPGGLLHQNLNDILDVVKNNNFNAIQLIISLEMVRDNPYINSVNCSLNHGFCGATAIRLLDIFIDRAAERGILIVLSNNQFEASDILTPPPMWFDSHYTEDHEMRLWNALLTRYRKQWNVFAIDLKNEPNGAATWGNLSNTTDWNKAAERMIKRIDASYTGLFFVDGIKWGTELMLAQDFPIETGNSRLNNRVVYTPHCYGPGLLSVEEYKADEFPSNLDEAFMKWFGFLAKNGRPVVIGEWSGSYDKDTRGEEWNNVFVSWLRNNCMTNRFYWSIDPNPGWTRGLLEDNWITPRQNKSELISRLQPHPTKFEARNGKICISKGAFPEAHCKRA